MDDDDVPQLIEVDEAAPNGVDKYERPKVPLTLLTGYLGAGKSTLLDYILTENHGYRIAVCMNDFGDTTDIESKSLQMSNPDDSSAPTESMLSLPNGCLCCSFKDMGIAAIEEMVAAQKDKIDWVVVELTGLADPAPIAKSFWANEEMGDLLLDSIVCVVDSRNILKQLDETRDDGTPNEAQKQAACADVILLNKTDLVTPTQLESVAAAIQAINPTLRVHRTERSQVPLPELFNLRAYSSPVAAQIEEHACGDGCDEAHHAHGHHQVTTATVPLPVLTRAQFDALVAFLESFLWDGRIPPPPSGGMAGAKWSGAVPDVLRTKGYVLVDDGSAHVIQGVADMFEVRAVNRAGDEVGPKLVFIGKGVDERLIAVVRAYIGV